MPVHDSRYRPASALERRPTAPRIATCLLAGLALAVAPAGTTHAQNLPQAVQSTSDPIAVHVTAAAQRFGVPERWIRAVIRIESSGDPHAISPAGAMGLMQVMPVTWAELRARHGLGPDPFDPRDNILAGAAYLRVMWDRYGTIGAMLAAYNAGPQRYNDHLASGRALPAETCAYVARLAPSLGGDPTPPGAGPGTPRAPDWREAALFVARPESTAPAPHLHDGRNAGTTPDAASLQEDRHTSRQPAGPFVARSSSEDRQ